MDLPLTVGELHDSLTVWFSPQDRAVGKHALLAAVWEEVLDGLVWECDLLRSVWIVLLCLVTGVSEWSKEKYYFCL